MLLKFSAASIPVATAHQCFGDEILPFIGVKERVESCDTLAVCLTPVRDAALGARDAGLLEQARDFRFREWLVDSGLLK